MTDPSSPETAFARARPLQPRARAGTAPPSCRAATGETGEEFTEEQLLELGREVGLSPQNLRQALAEERTRSIVPDEERGVAASLFGPSRVRAARTVPGKASEVLAAVDAWMQRQELLIVKRHHADRIVWEPRQRLPRRDQASVQGWRPRLRAVACVRGFGDGDFCGRWPLAGRARCGFPNEPRAFCRNKQR